MSKDKQGESTSNHARHQKQQIDVTIIEDKKESYNIIEESFTLQIASISSKMMTCRSLWSPEKENNLMPLVITKRPT